MSAENVVGYTTDRWQKGLTGKETHPKKSYCGSKGPFHFYDKAKKIKDKIKNYKCTHTKKQQINK